MYCKLTTIPLVGPITAFCLHAAHQGRVQTSIAVVTLEFIRQAGY